MDDGWLLAAVLFFNYPNISKNDGHEVLSWIIHRWPKNSIHKQSTLHNTELPSCNLVQDDWRQRIVNGGHHVRFHFLLVQLAILIQIKLGKGQLPRRDTKPVPTSQTSILGQLPASPFCVRTGTACPERPASFHWSFALQQPSPPPWARMERFQPI